MLQFKKGPPFKEDDCTLPVLLDYDFITLQVQKVRIDTQICIMYVYAVNVPLY